ncbi:MAG: hypothetical protein LBJ44_05255 [Propionibacteriaceae bacterium]|jgi:spermidine synthase|nr:hypothetical protein [Propionibacteriaceae bacterium]
MHDETVTTLAQSEEDGYEVALRRRQRGDQSVDELIINGVFAMDSADPVSEIALAQALGERPGRVLVAGLGLGYTARQLLAQGVVQLDVVELSQAMIGWAQAGLTDVMRQLASDPRVHFHHGDVTELLGRQPGLPGLFGPWDGICLDIDNGPDFLIHDRNAPLYSLEGLRQALSHLTPGGRLALWAQGPSKELWFDLVALDPEATEQLVVVDRRNRRIDYAIYSARQNEGRAE